MNSVKSYVIYTYFRSRVTKWHCIKTSAGLFAQLDICTFPYTYILYIYIHIHLCIINVYKMLQHVCYGDIEN